MLGNLGTTPKLSETTNIGLGSSLKDPRIVSDLIMKRPNNKVSKKKKTMNKLKFGLNKF